MRSNERLGHWWLAVSLSAIVASGACGGGGESANGAGPGDDGGTSEPNGSADGDGGGAGTADGAPGTDAAGNDPDGSTIDGGNADAGIDASDGGESDGGNADAGAVDAAPPVVSTAFVYDVGGRLIGEYDENGVALQELVYLEDRLVTVFQREKPYVVGTDQLGAPRALVSLASAPVQDAGAAQDAEADASADAAVDGGSGGVPVVVWRWDPEPFGSTAPDEDPDGDGTRVVFHERFPGQRLDPVTGLFQNFHRNYAPELGRYIEVDPMGLLGGANPYLYAEGNPVLLSDPLGLAPPGTVVTEAGKLPRELERGELVIANTDHGVWCKTDECRKLNGGDVGVMSSSWFGMKKQYFWPQNMPSSVNAKVFVNVLCRGAQGSMGDRFLNAGGRVYIGALGDPSIMTGGMNSKYVQTLVSNNPSITGSQIARQMNLQICRRQNPKWSDEECQRWHDRVSQNLPNFVCQGDCDIPYSKL